jgi:hypothetical protein
MPASELTSRRYEHASVLITDAACIVSLVDRLIHHAEILSLEGKSYRLKEAEARAAKRRGGRLRPLHPRPGPC